MENKLQCPCCNLERGPEEVQILFEQFNSSKRQTLNDEKASVDFDFLRSLLSHGRREWACVVCFKEGKAIASNPSKMNYSVSPKYLAYFDKKITCSTCKKEFIFSAKEQQYWFETLKFWHESYPTKCLECRKKIRQQSTLQTELSQLIKNLDKENPDAAQLQRIGEIYEELGIGDTEKARRYATLKKIKNKD